MYKLSQDGDGNFKVIKVFGDIVNTKSEKKKKNRSLIDSFKVSTKRRDKKEETNNNNNNNTNNNNNNNNNINNSLTSKLNSPKIERSITPTKKEPSPRSKSPRRDREDHLKFMKRSHSISNNLKTRKDLDLFAPLPKLSESIVPINHKKSNEI